MHVLHGLHGLPGPTCALYGAREALLQAPLSPIGDVAIGAFLDTCWSIVSAREAFRAALIAQGVFALPDVAGLRAQAADALKSGVLRVAPVPVSGLAPLKTEPVKAALSGKPFVMPPRINPPRTPAPPAPPAPRHKIAVESAEQNVDAMAGRLAVRPAGAPGVWRGLHHQPGADTHRLEWALKGLPNVPHSLGYQVVMRGGAPMVLLLIKSLPPVDQNTQQARWPTVLVPLLPLRYLTAELNRAQALGLAGGWIYIFVNGHLWRELQVVTAHGMLSDVDLGAHDGAGDGRIARGQYTRVVDVPYLLDGVEQKVELTYSPRPIPWDTLMKLGGLDPNDVRFTDAVKQRAANIPIDPALRKQRLQAVDLSSYGTGFNVEMGIIGPVAFALCPAAGQRDALDAWRSEPLPVVYLRDPDGATRRLYIGVFFDGTDNHKDRDRNRPGCDITNIARLYDLYPNQRELNIRSIYVHGVGTVTGTDDTTILGLAFATGDEGGAARIDLARGRLKRILEEHPDIDEIVFDFFGFSRGAALARHFVNMIHSVLDELKHICSVRVRFVGLFDTVGSFYMPGDADEGEFLLHLGPDSAEHVVHLTAHHEKRKNFPLTGLKDAAGNLPGHFIEKALPGVHADLGGGYANPGVNGNHAEELVIAKWDTEGNGSTRESMYRAIQGRSNAVRPVGPNLLLEVQRKLTQKELAIVALREMDKHARTHGVPLEPVKLDEPGYHLPEDLDTQIFLWRNLGSTMELATQYLKDYIHTSHRDIPLTWLDRVGNAPDPSGQRQVFPNQPQHATPPQPSPVKPPTCAP